MSLLRLYAFIKIYLYIYISIYLLFFIVGAVADIRTSKHSFRFPNWVPCEVGTYFTVNEVGEGKDGQRSKKIKLAEPYLIW